METIWWAIGGDRSGSEWIEVDRSGSEWIGVDRSGSEWVGLGRSGSDGIRVDRSGSKWIEVVWIGVNRRVCVYFIIHGLDCVSQ